MDDTELANKISKLPIWAQKHVEALKRERDQAVLELKNFHDKQTESAVSYTDYFSGGRFYVQTSQVDFHLDRNNRIMVKVDSEGIYLNGHTGRLVIKPHVSNAITVSIEP